MTSSREDRLNSDLFDGKALETLIIASVRTLKNEEIRNVAGKRFQN